MVSTILLLLFTLILRLHHLDFESLYMDELRQISYYPHSLFQIVHDAASQQQPPMDYWIGHIGHAFSYSDFAVRLPSALFGVGAVFFLTLIVSKICSWPVGLGAGIIAALLPFNLYFSQEARPYSIAIFFFLGVLWSLDRLLTSRERSFGKVAVLFAFSTAFLLSRTLSPLVVITVLIFILIARFIVLILREGITLKDQQDRTVLAGVTLIFSLLIYFPFFHIVLAKGARYADNTLRFGIETFINGIKHFNFFPIYKAFIVQTEPLTIPLSILLFLSPYFAWTLKLWGKNQLWAICSILLPMAGILNIFIFQAKSSLPFRPPYAICLLPLTIILAALSFQGLWNISGKMKSCRIIRILLVIVAAGLIFSTASSALSFKAFRKKTDWRGITSYLGTSFGPKQVLVFDSLSKYGDWEPTFYGFPRYYQGRSSMISMAQIPSLLPEFINSPHEPVVIIFQYREYYLTRHSKYPIIPLSAPEMKHIDYGKIGLDPLLRITEFTGFSIIRLKKSTNNFAGDTYTIINRLLLHFPKGTWLVELHLAATGLSWILGLQNWQDHLFQAEALVTEQNLVRVKNIGEYIRNFKIQ